MADKTMPAEAAQPPAATPAGAGQPLAPQTIQIDFATGLPVQSQGNNASPAVNPAPAQTPATAQAQPETPNAADKPAEQRTFTQADVDRLIKERLDRERKKADEATAKSKLEAEAAAKPELDRLRDELSRLQQRSSELEVAQRESSLKAAVAVEASKLGLDANAAYRLMDMARVSSGEDGAWAGIDTALAEVVKAYPGLVRPTTPATTATNPARQANGVPDTEHLRRKYFGGVSSEFWRGGGVVGME